MTVDEINTMAESTATTVPAKSQLNKQILNNFIVKNRPIIRRGKVQVINRLVRRAKEIRKKKCSNELEKEKNGRRADALINEVMIIKKFYVDDITKFALLSKKSLDEIVKNPNSPLEERALCRVGTWRTVAPHISKFQEQYPDHGEKVPVLLKTMGLQYRKQRLKRIDKRGLKEQFLEKEHHSMSIIQQLTDIQVDRRLLTKARDLMNSAKISKSESEENNNSSVGDRKRKNDQPENTSPKKKTKISEKKPIKKNERKSSKEKSSKKSTTDGEEQGEDSKKTAVKLGTEGDKETSLETNNRKVSKNKEFKNNKELNTEKDEGSDEEQHKETDSEHSGSEVSDSEEYFDGQEREFDGEDRTVSDDEEKTDERQNVESDNEDSAVSDNEEKSDEGQNIESNNEDSAVSDNEEKSDEGQNTESDNEDSTLSDNEENSDEEQNVESDSEDSAVSGDEGSEEFDSEGSEVDENYQGEKITSIWDDCALKTKDLKSSTNSKPKLLGDANLKCKGTVAVKQLDLSKKDCIDDLFQKDDDGVSSDSDEEDFFIRGPVSKKKKVTKTEDGSEDENNVVDDAESDSDSESDGNTNVDVTREKYLEHNFKKIWGQGMKDTIRLSQSRRGVRGGGRGRESGDRDGTWSEDRERWSDGRRGRGFDDRRGRGFDGRRGRGSDDTRGRGFDDRRGRGSRGRGGRGSDDRGGRDSHDGRGRGFDNRRGKDFGSNYGKGRGGFSSHKGRGFSGRGRENANLMPLGSRETPEESHAAPLLGKREYKNPDRKSEKFEHQRDSSWKSSKDSFKNRRRFSEGNQKEEQSDKGWPREKFQKKGSRNPNLIPMPEKKQSDAGPARKPVQQESLLHPSWLAKQKEREMASSIHAFKGQKKTFDFDD